MDTEKQRLERIRSLFKRGEITSTQLCNFAMAYILARGEVADTKEFDPLFFTCTLDQFMKKHCDIPKDSNKNYFISKRTLLNDRLKLPKPAVRWVSGRPKIFYEFDLLKKWPEYCIKCPTLPPLK